MTNIMSTQTLNLISEMKNSNKNTQSLIEKYDELLKILLKQKNGQPLSNENSNNNP